MRYSLFDIRYSYYFFPPIKTVPAQMPRNKPMIKPIFTFFKSNPIPRPMITSVAKLIFLLACMLFVFRQRQQVRQYFECAGISRRQLPEQHKANICKIPFAIFSDRQASVAGFFVWIIHR